MFDIVYEVIVGRRVEMATDNGAFAKAEASILRRGANAWVHRVFIAEGDEPYEGPITNA